MKKISSILLCICLFLCGCGVSEEEYNTKVSELEKIRTEYEQYKETKESEIFELNKSFSEEKNQLKTENENLNSIIEDTNEKNEKLKEEISSYQNVTLDTINLFFKEDEIVADEIVWGSEKWLFLTDTKFDFYDLVSDKIYFDTDTFALKVMALCKKDWFDYSNIVYNIAIKDFGIVGSIEINPTTFEIRQGEWAIKE